MYAHHIYNNHHPISNIRKGCIEEKKSIFINKYTTNGLFKI
jgi:hypothetical protein